MNHSRSASAGRPADIPTHAISLFQQYRSRDYYFLRPFPRRFPFLEVFFLFLEAFFLFLEAFFLEEPIF